MVSLVDRAEENRKANASRYRAFFMTVGNVFRSTVPDFISPQYQLWLVKTQVGLGDIGLKNGAQSPSFSVKNFLSIFGMRARRLTIS